MKKCSQFERIINYAIAFTKENGRGVTEQEIRTYLAEQRVPWKNPDRIGMDRQLTRYNPKMRELGLPEARIVRREGSPRRFWVERISEPELKPDKRKPETRPKIIIRERIARRV